MSKFEQTPQWMTSRGLHHPSLLFKDSDLMERHSGLQIYCRLFVQNGI
ncbi:hypothetical protein CEXT_645791, partial [Caerostris extrusa]